ncbi:TRAP transporter large permease [Ornithinimicrobium faecis]|uniref:TRAP transporter large permease n=1 Tax=Ornithinimicrobium faecis TaxID=2934158 RepID=A0ABY4YRG9_9MICO|nr:TRAP transporter large permease [Ornithinimicrobium sp. HY1793]USQ79172.1 TRAP transporter large permease [Ornithinimicrobium sp. HY1793]
MPAILGVGFAVLLLIGTPVAIAIGGASLLSMVLSEGIPLEVGAQRLVAGLRSFPLMAIPLFILAGSLMNDGGITRRLIDFAYAAVGSIRGGLAAVNILTNMIFGGISGSSVADASATGKILIPQMVKRGYTAGFAAALTALASTIAVVIPPSINLIIYGVTAEVSIGSLFFWGLYIGVAFGFVYILTAYVLARIKGYPAEDRVSRRELLRTSKDAVLALMIPVVVLGGIRFGVFTATEGGAVAVLTAVILGGLVYRELTWAKVKKSMNEALMLIAAIMLIIAMAQLYAWALVTGGIPSMVADFVLGISDNPVVILLVINVLFLLIGMVLEGNAAIIIFTPILLPVALAVGIDPVHLGLIIVINLAIGLLTPPVGISLLITTRIAGIPLQESVREAIPWLGVAIALLFAVTYIPLLL